MSVTTEGKLVLRDPETGKQFTVDLDFESEVHDPDREMGPEIVHIAEVDIEVGNENRPIRWEIYEYPVGCENDNKLDTDGLEVVHLPKVDIIPEGALDDDE